MEELKTSENQISGLRRDLHLVDAVGVGLGAIIGAGIFVVTGVAAAFTILLYCGITNIAALRLPAENKLYPKWVAALGLVSCLLLAFSLRLTIILTGLGLLFIGFILRLIFQRFNNSPAD